MRRAMALNALALLPIVVPTFVLDGCGDNGAVPDSADAASETAAGEPSIDAGAEGASPEGQADTGSDDGAAPDAGGSHVAEASGGDAIDAADGAADDTGAADASDAREAGPDVGGDSADAADSAEDADAGPLVCFDGGRPPSDWPTVYQDLFGPGPDGGSESKGHCARSDCHGGGFGGLYIDPWTPSATYRAFTSDTTLLGVLVDLDAGPASASLLGDPARSPLAWYGGPVALIAGMPADRSVLDPCAAAEVTAWLGAGAPGPDASGDGGQDASESDGGHKSDAGGGPGILTLSLDPSLDTPPDTIMATSITAAVLFDKVGVALETATIVGGKAVFRLTRIPAADYFIRINGDRNDLVPTRIDDPAVNVDQRVGKKLRASVIGASANPTYRINTWSAGQGESPVAQFSNGNILAGEHAYVIVSYGTPRIEFALMGNAAPLTSFSPGRLHPPDGEPFDKWLLVSNAADGGTAPPQHGVTFTTQVADGGAPTCAGCHTAYGSKPAQYSAIAPTNGWCFHCHNGPVGGDANGFVDPTK